MSESNPRIQASDLRPWTVIVRDGVVVGRYRAEDSYVSSADVSHVSLGDGPVQIYEVDARMPPPPVVGDMVTAEELQRWTRARGAAPECGPPQSRKEDAHG